MTTPGGDQAVTRRWRAHWLYLALLAVTWAGLLAVVMKEINDTKPPTGPSVAQAGAALGALAQGFVLLLLGGLGVGLLLYALVTSAVLKKVERRSFAPLWMHGSVAAVVLAAGGGSGAWQRRSHALEEQAFQESLVLAEARRTRHFACLRVEKLIIHPGDPLAATVTVSAGDCPTLVVEGVALEGDGPTDAGWANRHVSEYFSSKVTFSGEREFKLVDDEGLLEASDWRWTVLVELEAGEQVFCGPGASSPRPDYLSCRALAHVRVQ